MTFMNTSAKPHAFVSYVREDRRTVEKLCSELKRNDVAVWLDREKIRPGERWQVAIRRAIEAGGFFIACFSPAYGQRGTSYMNVELTLAVEQLRSRPADRAWFIPILFEGGAVPDRPIGGGETLRDIQWVDLAEDWGDGVRRILSVLRPESPQALPPIDEPATLVLLVTDLVGFSSAVQQLGDEEFRRVIIKGNDSLTNAVADHGGEVIALMGDGMLAAFESARQAIACALALQDYMSASTSLQNLKMRIGLAAGAVLRTRDSVVGTAVNLAARICSLAEAGEILISESVRLKLGLGDALQIRERGPVGLKGFAETLRIYEVRREPLS